MTDTPAPVPIITKEALARWNNLPPDAPLRVDLTRQELDNLFLAIREIIIGQSDLGAALVQASNQKMEDAQIAFNSHAQHVQAAIGHIDRLIVHAMKTAEPI